VVDGILAAHDRNLDDQDLDLAAVYEAVEQSLAIITEESIRDTQADYVETGPSTPVKKKLPMQPTPIKQLVETTEQSSLFNDINNFIAERALWTDELTQYKDNQEDDILAPGISASLITPSKETTEILASLEEWGDDPKLQRDNMEESKKALGIPLEADPPKLPCMRPNVHVHGWQLPSLHSFFFSYQS
jgi:hypothetical protein